MEGSWSWIFVFFHIFCSEPRPLLSLAIYYTCYRLHLSIAYNSPKVRDFKEFNISYVIFLIGYGWLTVGGLIVDNSLVGNSEIPWFVFVLLPSRLFFVFPRKRRGAINAKQLGYLEKYHPKSRLKNKNGHKSCSIMWPNTFAFTHRRLSSPNLRLHDILAIVLFSLVADWSRTRRRVEPPLDNLVQAILYFFMGIEFARFSMHRQSGIIVIVRSSCIYINIFKILNLYIACWRDFKLRVAMILNLQRCLIIDSSVKSAGVRFLGDDFTSSRIE